MFKWAGKTANEFQNGDKNCPGDDNFGEQRKRTSVPMDWQGNPRPPPTQKREIELRFNSHPNNTSTATAIIAYSERTFTQPPTTSHRIQLFVCTFGNNHPIQHPQAEASAEAMEYMYIEHDTRDFGS